MTSKDSLKKILGGGKPEPDDLPIADEESDALTIADMNGRYSSMRPANKSLTRMHVIDKSGKVRTYQYHFLDVESTFDGKSFTLTFAGTKHWQITVRGYGPKFWAIYDYCTTHRWPYLREASGSMPGVAGDGETVLTAINISDVTPRERDEH